ncbi:MAG: redoxin family protein [Opitutae bacterium]
MKKIFSLLLLLVTSQVFALSVGDKAPATRPKTQIKGEAVKSFEKGKLYIFECWATWCPPCVASIPHLNELNQKMGPKGVVITGVNVWDGEKNPEAAKKVKDFVKAQDDKMSYAVAIGGDKFLRDWLEAAKVDGIPHAFVINGDGVIVWMGHPMQLNEKLLGDLLTGTAAPEPDKNKSEKKTKDGTVKDETSSTLEKLGEALNKKNWDLAEKILPEALLTLNARDQANLKESAEAIIALGRGDPSKINAMYEKSAQDHSDNAEVQNEIAWDLLTNPRFGKNINLTLAEKCAVRAVALTKEEEADKLDTLARVRWLQGRKEEAIKLQEKAVSKASYLTLKEELQLTLDSLRKGVLPPGDPIDIAE